MHETFLNSDGKDHKESTDCRRFFSGVSHLLYMPSSGVKKSVFVIPSRCKDGSFALLCLSV
ncbi:MAG: hypothetical protein B6245_16655 [Desulfobacteraceae bacterium 4572_88]|nr:MAG: hypothetical protein B6245_16655 [Desulfobacteraceae bacterium 4572_88]RLC17361.1 MAG: hypothetical protein DRI57_09905 [Deltaproteobacteria bacterium]